MIRVLLFVDYLLGFYVFILLAAAILSWLIAFDVINVRNNLVRSLVHALSALTDPVLAPLRRVIPPVCGSRGRRKSYCFFSSISSFFIPLLVDFFIPFVDFFFIFISLGLFVFMSSWPGGAVVWPDAADMPPMKAIQHAAIIALRICNSPKMNNAR
jgi:YggT family protein